MKVEENLYSNLNALKLALNLCKSVEVGFLNERQIESSGGFNSRVFKD